jgi:integrase
MNDTRHLKRRRQGWYARLVVPEPLRAKLGRREWVQSLGTRDLMEANRRKHAVLADLQRRIHRAAFEASLPPAVAGSVMREARRQRKAVESGRLPLAEAEHRLDELLDRRLQAPKQVGRPKVAGTPNAADRERLHTLAHRVLHDEPVTSLKKVVATYLAEIAPHIRHQTHREKQRQLDDLLAWLGGDTEVMAVNRRIAGRYVTERLSQRGHSPKTQKDILSNLSAFWNWLEGRGFVEINPWRGMSRTLKFPMRGTRVARRAFKPDELQTLFEGLPTDDPLFALSAMALYAGLRREEIANLRCDDLDQGCLAVKQGKSRAAVRHMPIHPAIAPLIARLIDTAKSEYLIAGLLSGGADQKRGHYIGKRFGHAIRKLGLTDPLLVFHSLRHSFIQKCEEAGVPESTAKLLVGHSRWGSLTYGNRGTAYSNGVSLEALRREIGRISFGAIDDFIQRAAGEVSIERESRRRRRSVLHAPGTLSGDKKSPVSGQSVG